MDKVTNIPGRMASQILILSDKTVEGWDVSSCTNLTKLWGIKKWHYKLADMGSWDTELNVDIFRLHFNDPVPHFPHLKSVGLCLIVPPVFPIK